MVEITRGVHSIDDLGYPVPGVGFVSYIVKEKENDLTLFQFLIDPVTAAISAERISKVNFDKLLLAHHDSPVLENGQKEVEKAAAEAIRNLKHQQ